jgi:hypothetical protein
MEHFGQEGGPAGRLSVVAFVGYDPGRKAVAPAPICGQQIGQMRV